MKGYSFKSDAKNVSERNGTQIVLGEKGYQTKKNKGRKVVKDTTLKIMEKRRTERRKRNILYICLSFLRALYQKTNKTKTIQERRCRECLRKTTKIRIEQITKSNKSEVKKKKRN